MKKFFAVLMILAVLFTGCIFDSDDGPKTKPEDITGTWYSVKAEVELRFEGRNFTFRWGDIDKDIDGQSGTYTYEGFNWKLTYQDGREVWFQVQGDTLQFLALDERGKYVRIRPVYSYEVE